MLGRNKPPKRIEDKKASKAQDKFFLCGAILGFLALSGFLNEDYAFMLVFGGLSFAAFYFGGKIKTHFELKGQTYHYRK